MDSNSTSKQEKNTKKLNKT